jgi:hypothetical protein
MQAKATRLPQREKSDQARARAIVRFNGLLFYGLAVASFLETAAPLHATRLARVFATRPEIGLWLEQTWCPRCAELGRRLRDFVAATWPEFDWNAAYQEFHERYRRGPALAGPGRSVALEALGLCVASTQAAVFYRALARGAEEPALRALARQAAQGHGSSFDYSSALFERCARYERVGLLAAWRALHASCREARDFDVRVAFEPLAGHWSGAPTVPEIGYGDFRLRMAALIERHAALGRTERLLFRPWLARERPVPELEQPGKGPERRGPLAQQPVAA